MDQMILCNVKITNAAALWCTLASLSLKFYIYHLVWSPPTPDKNVFVHKMFYVLHQLISDFVSLPLDAGIQVLYSRLLWAGCCENFCTSDVSSVQEVKTSCIELQSRLLIQNQSLMYLLPLYRRAQKTLKHQWTNKCLTGWRVPSSSPAPKVWKSPRANVEFPPVFVTLAWN